MGKKLFRIGFFYLLTEHNIDIREKIERIFSRRRRGIILRDDLTPAAVLIPLFKKDGEDFLLFTRRTETVEHHKGQISFPGGIKEKKDKDLKTTAIREVFEEIGLLERDIDIVGELDDVETVTNFKVTPFVGFISYPYDFKVNEDEIEELIEAPFSFFLDRKNLREEEWLHQGEKRRVYVYQYNEHRIWGVTARILRNFIDLF